MARVGQVVVLSSLRHPNILQLIGVSRTGSGVLDAMVTELANGGSLRSFLTLRKGEVSAVGRSPPRRSHFSALSGRPRARTSPTTSSTPHPYTHAHTSAHPHTRARTHTTALPYFVLPCSTPLTQFIHLFAHHLPPPPHLHFPSKPSIYPSGPTVSPNLHGGLLPDAASIRACVCAFIYACRYEGVHACRLECLRFPPVC